MSEPLTWAVWRPSKQLGLIRWVLHPLVCNGRGKEREPFLGCWRGLWKLKSQTCFSEGWGFAQMGSLKYTGTYTSTYLESQWCCLWVSYSNGERNPQRRKNNRLEWLCTGGEALVEIQWERKKGIKLRWPHRNLSKESVKVNIVNFKIWIWFWELRYQEAVSIILWKILYMKIIFPTVDI